MRYVYILFSPSLNQYFTGEGHNVEDKIELLVQKYDEEGKIAKAGDLEIFLKIECASREQALEIEKHIKRLMSPKYMENLKNTPQMVEALVSKYKV